MEINNDFRFQVIEGIPNSNELEILLSLYKAIFEDARPEFFKQRINEKENVVSIFAFYNQKPIGFKVGYKYNKNTMYSWLGGVLKKYRKQGVAIQLAKLQENWAKQNNYSKLRTKSMNRFKSMIILNLKNNFDIKKVYSNENGQTKIIFEKNI